MKTFNVPFSEACLQTLEETQALIVEALETYVPTSEAFQEILTYLLEALVKQVESDVSKKYTDQMLADAREAEQAHIALIVEVCKALQEGKMTLPQ